MLGRIRDVRPEEGFTVIELAVAMFVLSVVLSVFFAALVSVQNAANREDHTGQNNDQARVAVEELDREIRSASVVYNPASEAVPNYAFRVYTLSNAATRGAVCELWQITSAGQLQNRTWPANTPSSATPWYTVATGIVNRSLSPAVPAFTLDSTPSAAGRTVDVVLMVNGNLSTEGSSTLRIQTAVTGRNMTPASSTSVCSATPP